MSRRGPSHVAHRPGARDPRDRLLPCDLYPAACPRAAGAPEPAPPLWAALSHGRPDAPGHRRGPQASRSRDRRPRRPPHLGPTTAPSPPPALCPARGGLGLGWHTLGAVSAPFLPARPCPLAALPAPLPRWPCADLRAGPTDLGGSLSGTCRAHALAAPPRHPARQGVGGLRERAYPGPAARPPIPGPLHPPRRHLQPPSRGPAGWPGHLPLQRLPARPPPAHRDAGGRGVFATADAARPAARLPQDAPLRLLGQPGAPGEAGAVPHPLGARHPTPCPGSGCGPQDTRGISGGARGHVSSLPARAHAAGQNIVSTAGGVGPV